jgi:hypothetical protein
MTIIKAWVLCHLRSFEQLTFKVRVNPMNTLCQLASRSLFIICSNICAATAHDSGYVFSHETSSTPHERYGGMLTMSLLNQTGYNLDQFRIFVVVKKDPFQPYIPSNVLEYIWRMSADESEVVLPIMNLDFSLMIFWGDFNDEHCDREVIEASNSKQVYFIHGEEVDPQTQWIRLSVNYEFPR